MKAHSHIHKTAHWAFGPILAGMAMLAAAPAAVAQERQQQGQEREVKQTVAMSQKIYEKLSEVQELVEAKQYNDGLAAINELLNSKQKMTPYETAQIHNLTGYTYYLMERFPDAIRAYEQVLAQPELPEALQQSTLKTMAQLYFTIEDYRNALNVVNRLIRAVTEEAASADIWMLRGQAYFQMEDYDQALPDIKKAVDMYKQQGRTPRENWLLLLRVCYFEKNDFPNMIVVLKELIQYYPKDTYVLTLAGVYSELGETKKQLALAETLYDKGVLANPSHLVNLANLFLLHESPYKAAVLLEKEIEAGSVEPNVRNLRLLSQAWYAAREDDKAIPPLRQAAELSDDGELYIRLAQSHINLEQWRQAVDSVREGLRLGGLDRADQANIMLGMALFNLKQFSQARRAFQAAMPDQRSRRTAQQWIAYVDSEIRRSELMDQDLPEMQPREIDDILQANSEQ